MSAALWGGATVAGGEGENVERLLQALRSRSEAARANTAAELKVAVEMAAREMSSETFARFEAELYSHVFMLVHATDLNEKVRVVKEQRTVLEAELA